MLRGKVEPRSDRLAIATNVDTASTLRWRVISVHRAYGGMAASDLPRRTAQRDPLHRTRRVFIARVGSRFLRTSGSNSFSSSLADAAVVAAVEPAEASRIALMTQLATTTSVRVVVVRAVRDRALAVEDQRARALATSNCSERLRQRG